jgi:hypothetical protein
MAPILARVVSRQKSRAATMPAASELQVLCARILYGRTVWGWSQRSSQPSAISRQQNPWINTEKVRTRTMTREPSQDR